MESCSNQKSVFEILQISQPLSWWQLWTLLAFSQFLSFLMRLSQSVVLWQDRGGIQKIGLFGIRPSPYYGKKSSKKQRDMKVHQYFKTWRSVNWKFLQVQSQKPSSSMMKLALMRTATGKSNPELPLLQRISS